MTITDARGAGLLVPAMKQVRATGRSTPLGLLIGLLTLALTYAAHVNGRPITSAIVALFGVMAVGAVLGARAGILAGIAASLTFNLVFTDPAWTFTYSTADDLVPMIALTLASVGSAVLAGRLRDRAISAETATKRVADLLGFSEDLQSAVTPADIEAVVRAKLGPNAGGAWLFLETELGLVSPGGIRLAEDAAQQCWHSHLPSLRSGAYVGHLLKSADRRLGVLVLEDGPTNGDVSVFLPLITLAIQRCQLAEQLTEADLVRRSEQFKTALLSSVSHDLRTPIAAISASASSMIELGAELGEATTRELLTTIQEQCARLDRFTRNLLSLGRIEGGLDAGAMPRIDAVEVLGGTLSRIRQSAGSHVFRREFVASAALVRADEALLEQLFLNILENAVTHTPAGTAIRVRSEVSGGRVVIAVEDDGKGIPEQERERVFERFHQVAPQGKHNTGSGLGLSIAKGFAELFGGTIKACAARSPMRGARIELSLPLTAAR